MSPNLDTLLVGRALPSKLGSLASEFNMVMDYHVPIIWGFFGFRFLQCLEKRKNKTKQNPQIEHPLLYLRSLPHIEYRGLQ